MVQDFEMEGTKIFRSLVGYDVNEFFSELFFFAIFDFIQYKGEPALQYKVAKVKVVQIRILKATDDALILSELISRP